MACGLKVLMNVREDLEEKFTEGESTSLRTPEGKAEHQEALREIYDDRCRKVNSEGEYDGRLYGSVTFLRILIHRLKNRKSRKGMGLARPSQTRSRRRSFPGTAGTPWHASGCLANLRNWLYSRGLGRYQRCSQRRSERTGVSRTMHSGTRHPSTNCGKRWTV